MPARLCGDARYDSPGFSAKFMTYFIQVSCLYFRAQAELEIIENIEKVSILTIFSESRKVLVSKTPILQYGSASSCKMIA